MTMSPRSEKTKKMETMKNTQTNKAVVKTKPRRMSNYGSSTKTEPQKEKTTLTMSPRYRRFQWRAHTYYDNLKKCDTQIRRGKVAVVVLYFADSTRTFFALMTWL